MGKRVPGAFASAHFGYSRSVDICAFDCRVGPIGESWSVSVFSTVDFVARHPRNQKFSMLSDIMSPCRVRLGRIGSAGTGSGVTRHTFIPETS